ncbi:hypothetical protein D0868_03541, partial [Hortaea werneckii]
GQTVIVYLYTLKSWQGYHFYDIPDLTAKEHASAKIHPMVARCTLRHQVGAGHSIVAESCQCTPVSFYWDHNETDKYDAEGNVIENGGTCIQQVEVFLITAGLFVWTEIILMSISMAVVLSLKMKKASKVAIGTVMSLSWTVVSIGITRIALYYYRFQPDNVDRSYSLSYTISGAEVNM